MSRISRAVGLLTALFALALAAPSASMASCGLFGLFKCPTYSEPPPAETPPDGSLTIRSNPYELKPLPLPVAGESLYPRESGHLYFGLADNSVASGMASLDEVAGIAESVGASFVRVGLYWPSIEFQPDSFTWDFFDREYRTFVAHGLRPLWTIFFTPRWAAPEGAKCSGKDSNYCESEPADTPAARAALRDFGHDIAVRYPLSAGFTYRNEPNLDAQNRCTDDPTWSVEPEDYTRGLLIFAAGVHAGRPAARVLGGELSGCPMWDRAGRYLDAMLTAGAAKGMDAVAWHPYDTSATGSWFERDVDAFAAVLRDHDATDMRIAATEVGNDGDEATQSERLRSQYMRVNTQDQDLDLVGNYDLFTGFETLDPTSKSKAGYGWLVRKDWFNKFQAKRVFCDFRALLGLGRPLPSYVRNCML